MNVVERFLRSPAVADRVDGWRPTGSIVLTPRFPDSRHVVVLLLGPSGRPQLVGKVVRAPGDPSSLGREVEVLEAVRARMSPASRDSLPEPVALDWFEGHRLMVQRAVEGHVITHGDARRRPGLWWRRVDDWLATLPHETALVRDATWFSGYLGDQVRLARQTLDAVDALTPALDEGLEATVEHARVLAATVPHLVAEHGDLSHPNLVWGPRGIAVVDWETATPLGLPGVDAAVYATFLAFSRARAHGQVRELEVFRRELVAPGGRSRALLQQHLLRSGADPALVDRVLVTAWAKVALSAFSRLLTGPAARSEDAARRATGRFAAGSPTALWNAALTVSTGSSQ